MSRRLSPARPAIAGPRRSPPLRSPRRAALTLHLAAACLAAGVLPAHAQQVASDRPAQAPAPRSYDIPAGPLQAALARFSAEAGVYLAGATELVDGKHSPGLKGRFGATDGLPAGGMTRSSRDPLEVSVRFGPGRLFQRGERGGRDLAVQPDDVVFRR